MSLDQTIVLRDANAMQNVIRIITKYTSAMLQAGKFLAVRIYEWDENRTEAQNRAMWPILTAFSKQIEWPVNGRMQLISPEDWKDILTAAFRQETARMAEGLNGGIVLLGARTRKFKKKEFSDWMEFLNCTAAERGVRLPADKRYEDGYV